MGHRVKVQKSPGEKALIARLPIRSAMLGSLVCPPHRDSPLALSPLPFHSARVPTTPIPASLTELTAPTLVPFGLVRVVKEVSMAGLAFLAYRCRCLRRCHLSLTALISAVYSQSLRCPRHRRPLRRRQNLPRLVLLVYSQLAHQPRPWLTFLEPSRQLSPE